MPDKLLVEKNRHRVLPIGRTWRVIGSMLLFRSMVKLVMLGIMFSPAASLRAQTPAATTTVAPAGDAAAVAPSADGTITMSIFGQPVERVAAMVSQRSGKNVIARGKTVGQRSGLIARNETIERALDRIVAEKPNWLWYKPEDQPNTYEIWDQESFRAEVLPRRVRQKVYIPREITAEEAYKAITGVLTPNIGAASFDPRSNKVIVTDLPEVLELIQRLIEQIDVKFVTRVFYIRHADVTAISEKLANLKSPAAPTPEVDVRTHQIIVRDRLDIIRQMDLLVETLDTGPEMREYDLNNLGFEGLNRQEIEDAITAVVTPDAFWRVNVQAGKLLVEDVIEVHEKIEKILAAFDQPAKQVLIQAEIIETDFREGFNFNVDYTLSRDLFAAVIDGLTGRATGGTTPTPGSVPVGSGTVDRETLGFLDFRREFPIATIGGGGLNASFLTRNAFIQLQTAMSDSRTRVLQQPRLLIENQKVGIFTVGTKVPYLTGGSYGSQIGTGQQLFNQAQPVTNFANVGLDMEIHPTINNNGLVNLEVEIRNDAFTLIELTFAGQLYEQPQIATQELQTSLLIPSGETRVIGGLVSDSKGDSRSGVPFLYKIPIIGGLFGDYNRPSDLNFRRNLLIFLTPTIVIEKPAEVHKYKGRIIVDEGNVDIYTTPSATLTDMQCEPLPVFPPTPVYEPGQPVDIPADKVIMPEKGTTYETIETETRTEIPEPEPTVIPMMDTEVEVQQEIEVQQAPATDGVTEMRRMKIEEQVVRPTDNMLPPLAGPRGNLTGGTTGATGATGAPGTVPTVPGATGLPQPGVPPGGVVTPAPTPVATVATPIPTAPPALTRTPAPPGTETRFNR